MTPSLLAQDSPDSWLVAGDLGVWGVLDGILLQPPWGGDGAGDYFVARLEVPATNDLPIITVAPQDTTIFETRPLLLQAAAASISPLGYQWASNSAPVSHGATNTLAFSNATVGLSADYSVWVSNANGRVQTAPARVTVLPLTELAEALNATNLQWRLGGARGWNLDTNVTHDGVLALRTDYLLPQFNPVQDCWIETTFAGPGVLSFWWKASTATHNPYCNCDEGFQFILDGVQQFEIIGEVDWQSQAVPIGNGAHVARWYWSEPDGPGNLNSCWVDQVSFQNTPSAAPLISGLNWMPDGQFQFTIATSAPGATLGIEACSDLRSWLPIGQLVATNGVAVYTHAAATNFPHHFYRAVLIGP